MALTRRSKLLWMSRRKRRRIYCDRYLYGVKEKYVWASPVQIFHLVSERSRRFRIGKRNKGKADLHISVANGNWQLPLQFRYQTGCYSLMIMHDLQQPIQTGLITSASCQGRNQRRSERTARLFAVCSTADLDTNSLVLNGYVPMGFFREVCCPSCSASPMRIPSGPRI